jgi:hypothetical protein
MNKGMIPSFFAISNRQSCHDNSLVRIWSVSCESVDIMLIDTAMTGTTHALPLSLASEQVMIVISGSAASLTSAYALIKMMSQGYAKQHFLILVSTVESETESLAIYQNLHRVARQYLSVAFDLSFIFKEMKNYVVLLSCVNLSLRYFQLHKLQCVSGSCLMTFFVLHARISITGGLTISCSG